MEGSYHTVLVKDYSEFKELGIHTLRKDAGESVVMVFTRWAVDLNIAETFNSIWVKASETKSV